MGERVSAPAIVKGISECNNDAELRNVTGLGDFSLPGGSRAVHKANKMRTAGLPRRCAMLVTIGAIV